MTAGERMTVPKFRQRKSGTPLVVLTAYDFPFAKIFDEAGVDALLVGDSIGTVLHGEPNTLGVTMEQIIYHTKMVAKAATRSLVIADMPFLSYQVEVAEAIRNAGRLLKEAGAHAVKLEGGERSAANIAAITRADIPVMGHVGLTPQSIQAFGGYRVQRQEDRLLADAKAVEQAGAFAMVLEGVPAELAAKLTASVSIPTIGIGAGPHCDGQVLVWTDAMGLDPKFQARYVKRFADLYSLTKSAIETYAKEVQQRTFPAAENSYK